MKFVATDDRSSSAPEPTGRDGVARSLLEDGPATARELSVRLGITATAVRRHLDYLEQSGDVVGADRAPYGPPPRAGRGRPARVFAVSPLGRARFTTGYDDLALSVLSHLSATGGDEAVRQFARSRAAELEAALRRRLDEAAEPTDAEAVLAAALSDLGYAADVQPARGGHQLCQHHCPVARVAEQFPQLCEAETEVIGRVLGSHVQRLATIAHGDGVCTTVIPVAVEERTSA